MSELDFNWKPCNEQTANALLSGSNAPGQLWKFESQFLPPAIAASMSQRGPVEFYVSGSVNPIDSGNGYSGLGEMAAVRYQNDEAIPYRWLFAASGSGAEPEIFYGAYFKEFEPRHFPSGSIPVEQIFSEPNPSLPPR